MSSSKREHAVNAVADLRARPPMPAAAASLEHYAEDVFSEAAIRRFLSKETAVKLLATISGEAPFDPEIADEVAQAMKEWAVSRGATHFTHWFQPLNGGTAEKHDAFIEPAGKGQVIMEFSGKKLIVGEPDASSFPSGGLRSTFEARGYTAWDPTSPAFIKRHANGATLCVPSIFCSYTGEVLDKKTPVLRSQQALAHAVQRLMRCFGQPDEHVHITLGIEQEYFLIDKKFYLQRPDLIQAGRTLFGAPPAKHQQLEDHYFGSIKPRVLAFMEEVENELWKLGIPAKTRHNETAPAQFELAPIFEDQNLAIDHNMLIMEVLRQVSERNGLVCLLHEKPFAGINGSGKHNNWGLSYGTKNLLDPGETPQENAIFLTLLTAIIRAVDIHSDLLRAATATADNDHRLGSHEAPPAIISIFLGEQLTEVLDRIGSGVAVGNRKPAKMRLGVDSIPVLPRDTTDRNRTSPFAFTGNKFEFRAPGSSQSCAEVNLVLNTIVAESLDYFADRLEPLVGVKDFNKKLQELCHESLVKHRRIIFNGDNYGKEWLAEAARRGLPNLASTLPAIDNFRKETTKSLFQKYGVLSNTEIDSRYEVFHEVYHRKIRIEGEIGLEIARSMIGPAAEQQFGRLAAALANAKACGLKAGTSGLKAKAQKIGDGIDQLSKANNSLAAALHDGPEKIIDALRALRAIIDALELDVDDDLWPLPKYREMLFIY